MFIRLYNSFFAYMWYYTGDFACKINTEWAANLYQYAMNKSLEYDEKVEYRIWKAANNEK